MVYFLNWFLVLVTGLTANPVAQPEQPAAGPGGADYLYEEVRMTDRGETEEGFWLFEPVGVAPDTAHLVVFLHGYGAMNPMIYGGWIRHLVRKGNVVVVPRYQKGILSTPAKAFPANSAKAIKEAMLLLDTENHTPVYKDAVSYIGHSYGGVISAHLADRYLEYDLPFPASVLLCSPGSGPLRGAVLDEYTGIPASTRLLILFSDRDHVVGDQFSQKVFESAVQVRQRNLIKQFSDSHGEPAISSGHNESYSLDEAFDVGIHNHTTNRALRLGKTNAVDYYGYWKLSDALLSCARSGADCEVAFGDTDQQRYLGHWSDGRKIRELEVWLP